MSRSWLKGMKSKLLRRSNLWFTGNSISKKPKKDDKIHLFTLLSSNEPIVDGFNITVLVENIALEATLQDEKIDLLNFLRASLRNFDIQLTSKRIAPKKSDRIYSNKDKYAYLVEKNPQLEEFRQRFNLDLLP